MKKILILIVSLSFGMNVMAQMAVIEDKDGYTNVRQEPNIKSKVIYKLKEGEVFFVEEEIKGWTTVYLSYDKFSEDVVRRGTMRGYVHTSRIRTLENMKKYKGDEYSFEYITEPFSKEGKTIQKEGDNSVDRINEDYFWGTDGELPKIAVKELNIIVNDKKIEIPKNLITDIYEVTNDFSCYKIGDTFIVFQGNSDGAGYYEIAWVFNKNGLVQRLVGNPT